MQRASVADSSVIPSNLVAGSSSTVAWPARWAVPLCRLVCFTAFALPALSVTPSDQLSIICANELALSAIPLGQIATTCADVLVVLVTPLDQLVTTICVGLRARLAAP